MKAARRVSRGTSSRDCDRPLESGNKQVERDNRHRLQNSDIIPKALFDSGTPTAHWRHRSGDSYLIPAKGQHQQARMDAIFEGSDSLTLLWQFWCAGIG
jgi:hypothetical protein